MKKKRKLFKTEVRVPAVETSDEVNSKSAAGKGLPAPESVVGELEFISPKGNRYRIIKTTEMDAYDKPTPQKGTKKRSS